MPPAKRKQADEPAFLEGPEAEVPSGSEDDDDDFPSSDEEEEGESEGEEGDSEGAEDDADGNFGLSDGDEDPGQAGEGAGPAQNKPRNFLAGEKGDSFARAFAKLIGRAAGTDNDERPAKKIRTADEEAATAAGASDSDNDSEGDRTEGGAGPSGQLPSLVPLLKAVHAGPILAGSRSLARRQQDVRKEGEAEREGRKMRAALKKRGHAVVTKKGEDLAADAAERALQKIATKGVVRLFNAVSKAQKAQREAQALGQENAKLSKASFFAELKGEGANKRASAGATVAAGGAPGWDVLGGSIQGLTSGTKMRDWDRQPEDGEEDDGEDEPGGRGVDEQADYELSDSEDERSEDEGSEEGDEDEDEDGAW